MAGSEDQGKSKADVERILVEFDEREPTLTAFCAKTKSLIEASLEDVGIRYHSVQQRVKNRKKLREKYLDPTKEYQRLDDITDLAGLRVITYYEDDIDRVAEVIKREFRIDPENSIDKRETEPDRFGYSAVNYVCGHLEKRSSDVEYKKFSGVRCEIQITSVLRHAWSEIEHEWYDLKEAYPKDVKRRFYRLAALLELAESEFLDLRKSKAQYERSVAVQVEAKVPDLPVDAVSLSSFVGQDSLVAEIDRSIALLWGTGVSDVFPGRLAELAAGVARTAGLTKLQDVRDSLIRYRAAVLEYVSRCRKFWPEPPSPAPIAKGVCIINLAMMLISVRGVDAVLAAQKPFGSLANWDIAQQVSVAREVVAKY